jgi:hypothetical protein
MKAPVDGEQLWGYSITFLSTTGLTPVPPLANANYFILFLLIIEGHKGEVEVRFGEEFSGQPLPAEHHQAMEALWSAKTALNPLFFNGLKVQTPSREYSRVCDTHN